jgi:AraC-like DNA-binding protein
LEVETMNRDTRVVPLQLHPMGFIEAFTRLGADLDVLLDGTGINRGQLERGCGHISYAQQAQLLANGIRACDQPGLGLLVGMEFGWCFHGPVGYVVDCSPSLRDAGEAFRRYMTIPQPYYVLVPGTRRPTGIMETRDWYAHTLSTFGSRRGDDALALFETELRLAMCLRLWDLCGNKKVSDPSVHVRLGYREPAHGHLYERLPCDSVTFGCARTQVAVHRDFLLTPWRPWRRPAFDRLLSSCEATLRQTGPHSSYTETVRTHISEAFNRPVHLEEIAARLGMTPRALGRRLADEGSTFRGILHEVRMAVTLEHLRWSRLDVEEIAELMGFSCASSLRRAVKRWSGRTAGEMRSEGLRDDVAGYHLPAALGSARGMSAVT